MVQNKKAERLAIERQHRITSRCPIVEKLYKSYLKCLKPSQVFFQPCVVQVCELPKFNDLVQAADDVNIDAASFAEAMEMLPGLIIAWTEERRKMLLDLISASSKELAGTTTSGASSQPLVPPTAAPVPGLQSASLSATEAVDPLSLATSVFECGEACARNISPWGRMFGNCLIAWEGVNTHQCKRYITTTGTVVTEPQAVTSMYKFSQSGSAAAASLILAAGLKTDRATPMDMDRLDLLFSCHSCGPQRCYSRNEYGYFVYTWRSAVCCPSLFILDRFDDDGLIIADWPCHG
jgi:hypothetical protein